MVPARVRTLPQVWTPDIEHYNMADPIHSSVGREQARVSSDGEVFWSRPGMLSVLCRFEGPCGCAQTGGGAGAATRSGQSTLRCQPGL